MRILIVVLLSYSFLSCVESNQEGGSVDENQEKKETLSEKNKEHLFDSFYFGNYFVPSNIDAIDTEPEFLKQANQTEIEEKLKNFIEENNIDVESLVLEDLKKKSDESLDSIFSTVP